MQLKHGTVLQGGRYRIEKMLGQGGFGITYLAFQPGLERYVAIKEFFMKEHCNRDADTSHVSIPSVGSRELVTKFKEKFIKEAQMIAGYEHPNIVTIYDNFEENGTAYYVMKYYGDPCGNSTANSLSALPLPLACNEAAVYIRQVASALSYLHERNTMHLDVKPSNVLIDREGNAVLIDFGVSKRYDKAGHQTSSTPVGLSHGYAPGEQYQQSTLGFSPTTDIYALGATYYKLVTGDTPPDQNEVTENGLPPFPQTVPSSIAALIKKSMQPRRKDRPQSIAEFLGLLDVAHQQALTEAKVDETEEDAGDTKIYEGKEEVEGGLNDKDAGEETGEEIGGETWVHTGSEVEKNDQTDYSGSQSRTSETAVKPKKSRRWVWWVLAGLVAIGAFWFMLKPDSDKSAVSDPTGYHEGHGYVDLGLPSGVKWATCNVGAANPEEYGDYFAWGEISPKSSYDYDNCASIGKSWDDIGGNSSRDAARANWGGNWRLPTKSELEELKNNCTWTWTTQNGHKGHKVTGPNGESIFLPAAGFCYWGELYRRDEVGCYWCSSPVESTINYTIAYGLWFGESEDKGPYVKLSDDRDQGHSVRPVLED